MDLNYHSIESLLKAAKENNCRLSALVLEQQAEQMELPKQEIYKKMRENYRVMASCIQPGSAPDLKSTSGLTGGDAYRMRTAVEQGKNLTGPLLGGALYRALAVSELNASMGRIVARLQQEAAALYRQLYSPCRSSTSLQKRNASCPFSQHLQWEW